MTNRPNVTDTISAGYSTSPGPDKATRRAERVRATFEVDERYERLLQLPPAEREALLATSPAIRTAYGYYVNQRAIARGEG